jgi:hypothetical protein
MPNWTSNRLYIEGNPSDIREFLDAIRSQDQLFDFNRIIPMPELLRETATGHCFIDGKPVTSWYVGREASAGNPEEVRAFTREEECALRDIGYSNWYDWANSNWGTKWNACDPRIDDSEIDRGYVEITFDTAWCAPEPIFRKLIRLFPKLTFDCRWRNEDDDEYPHYLGKESAGDL